MVLLYQSGVNGRQSFVHPSVMAALVAKAVICLGLIEIKSNLSSAAHKEEARDLQTAMPPTDLPSSTWHRQAIDSCLLPHHVEWMEDVARGLASHLASLQ